MDGPAGESLWNLVPSCWGSARRRDGQPGGSPSPVEKFLPAIIVDPLGCQGSAPPFDGQQCCALEEAPAAPGLFAPCMVCAWRPAAVVDIPCGHANVCTECYGDYQTNARCLRCRDKVNGRVSVEDFVDEVTGRPQQCNVCKRSPANVVIIPCAHMCLCAQCLPEAPRGCPTCGARVERTCFVRWYPANGELPESSQGAEDGTVVGAVSSGHFPRLPVSVGALPAQGASRDGLTAATEDVDHEISRLEQQLRRLRRLSQASSRTPGNPQGGRRPERQRTDHRVPDD